MSTFNPAPQTTEQQIAALQQKVDELEAQQSQPKSAGIWSTIFTHWKSTANGVLALFITIGLALLATGNTVLSPKMVTWITVGLGVARAITGAMSKDAGALTSADISKQTAVATAKQA